MELREIGKSISKYMDLLISIDQEKTNIKLMKEDLVKRSLEKRSNENDEFVKDNTAFFNKCGKKIDSIPKRTPFLKWLFIIISFIVFGYTIYLKVINFDFSGGDTINIIIKIAINIVLFVILLLYLIFKAKSINKIKLNKKIGIRIVFNFIIIVLIGLVDFLFRDKIISVLSSSEGILNTIYTSLFTEIALVNNYLFNILVYALLVIFIFNFFLYILSPFSKRRILHNVAEREVKNEVKAKFIENEINLQLENDIRAVDNNSQLNILNDKLKDIYIPKFILCFLLNLKYSKGLFVEMLMASEATDSISSIMSAVGTNEMMLSKEDNFKVLEKKIEDQNLIIASLLNKNKNPEKEVTLDSPAFNNDNKRYNNSLDGYLNIIFEMIEQMKKLSQKENDKYQKTKTKIVKTEKIEIIKAEEKTKSIEKIEESKNEEENRDTIEN